MPEKNFNPNIQLISIIAIVGIVAIVAMIVYFKPASDGISYSDVVTEADDDARYIAGQAMKTVSGYSMDYVRNGLIKEYGKEGGNFISSLESNFEACPAFTKDIAYGDVVTIADAKSSLSSCSSKTRQFFSRSNLVSDKEDEHIRFR